MTNEELYVIYAAHQEIIAQSEKIISLKISKATDLEVFYREKAKAYLESAILFESIARRLKIENNPAWFNIYEWSVEDHTLSRMAVIYQEVEEELKKPNDERYPDRYEVSKKLVGKQPVIILSRDSKLFIPYESEPLRDPLERPSRFSKAIEEKEQQRKNVKNREASENFCQQVKHIYAKTINKNIALNDAQGILVRQLLEKALKKNPENEEARDLLSKLTSQEVENEALELKNREW